MSNIIHGRNLIVKMGGQAIAACTSCSISITGDLIEVASPTSGKYKEFIPGRISWSVSSAHLVTHGIMLSAASLINQKVDVQFSFSENELHTDDGVVLSGKAIVNQIKIDAAICSLAKGSFNFQGTGELNNADKYSYLIPKGNDGFMASSQPVIVRKYNK